MTVINPTDAQVTAFLQKRVARAMAIAWSKIGGDVFDQDPHDLMTDLSNLKVEGNVDFIALARLAIAVVLDSQLGTRQTG